MSDLIDFVVFFFKFFLYALVVLGIIALFIGACFGLWWVTLPYVPPPVPTIDPLDIYEEALNRCQARETLSDEQCHDAALREAYPVYSQGD